MKMYYDEAVSYLVDRAIETVDIEAGFIDLTPGSERHATIDYICLRDDMRTVAEPGDMSQPWERFACEALTWSTMKRMETGG